MFLFWSIPFVSLNMFDVPFVHQNCFVCQTQGPHSPNFPALPAAFAGTFARQGCAMFWERRLGSGVWRGDGTLAQLSVYVRKYGLVTRSPFPLPQSPHPTQFTNALLVDNDPVALGHSPLVTPAGDQPSTNHTIINYLTHPFTKQRRRLGLLVSRRSARAPLCQ